MAKLIWRNLWRNKRRTALTLASVAVALVLLSLLGTVLDTLTSVEASGGNRIVVRHAISLAFDLPEAYEERLRTLDHVEAVTILDWFQGTYKDSRPENFFPRFGTDPDTLLDVFPEYEISDEEVAAWRAERTAFIAGAALAEKYGWKIGDRITIEGDIYPVDVELTLRGIFREPNNPSAERQLYFHRRYVQEALGNPGTVGTYFLRVDSAEAVPEVAAAAEAMFANSADQVRAETEEAFALSFVSMLGNVRFFFGAIGLAVIVSILFITANTMAMAARERITEVAVLRTLGFRRSQVTGVVLGESLAVGVGGALLGLGIFAVVLQRLGPMLQDANLFASGGLSFGWDQVLLGIGVGLLLGLLSGMAPAWLAARLPIVDGLRRVA